jgi:S-adenosylmethionine/arginine decarboxylase-like enzyme
MPRLIKAVRTFDEPTEAAIIAEIKKLDVRPDGVSGVVIITDSDYDTGIEAHLTGSFDRVLTALLGVIYHTARASHIPTDVLFVMVGDTLGSIANKHE